MFVPFIHWLGRAGEKLGKMFTSEIFAMNAIQTGSSMLLCRSLTSWVCDGVMFITRVVMFGQLQQQQITGRHDAPDWTSRNDDGALGKLNNSQPTSPVALQAEKILINLYQYHLQYPALHSPHITWVSQQSFIYERTQVRVGLVPPLFCLEWWEWTQICNSDIKNCPVINYILWWPI